ncbi:glycosyl transferase [Mycobacterium antarcticum]|uniref:glycosyltransferase n=1 Tax=unclassified Mycolicibacterium TaxID=2636767 RepID=UPI0023A5FE13|nr:MULTISPECIES: glycosyltransferase family 2 protein [unclassified Mycolicibacterium]BDX35081.1 glycosyl transferase [Mycolicibacterium sp. TUM20985]GLP81360.1 glycosyl transferase [Mycolicibacterium sp. TUM20984]
MPFALSSETRHAVVVTGTSLACLGTAHQLVNQRRLRQPPRNPAPVTVTVSLLVPARDEAHRIAPTIRSLLGQRGLTDVEVVVLDDRSTDGTADVVRRVAGSDPRLRVLTGTPPPPGWFGKPHACAQLAAEARGQILVFVDADVVLSPDAVAAAVAVLRGGAAPLDLLCPWPRQTASGLLGILVQPLLAWSWLTTLPLRRAERSRRPSMAVANGQFLLVEAEALARAGGWQSVAGAVLDDIALARAVRASGGHTGVADGSALATCRMYDNGHELREGYRKSLWAAFGSPVGALAVAVALAVVYVVPAAAAGRGSRVGALGYAAAVVGRLAARRWCGGRFGWDAMAHPLSVVTLLWLLASSWAGRWRGTLSWKGRAV